jgi:putative membrane protein
MMKMIINVLAVAATLLLISQYVPGISVASFYTALIVAVLWGIIGLTIRPILTILTLPITLITFGLFSFIINALLFWFLATFIAGFSVAGFIPALIGSALLSAVSWILHSVL